jgi:citrate lyase subunit beta / citryl-CoA lyase
MRSLLFVPANNAALVADAAGLAADAIVLDLESSVPLAEKEAARAAVPSAIATLAAAGKTVWVRINSTFSLLARDDLHAAVSRGLSGILVPHCERPEQLLYLEALLRDAEPAAGLKPGSIRLIPAIESAAALLRAAEIARASERAAALQFGGGDFTADLGVARTPAGPELAYARAAIAVAARAARIPALDTTFPFVDDEVGLLHDAQTALALGMAGKALQHAAQLATINTVFTPDPATVARAQAIVAAYRAAEKEGQGAIEVEGELVDAPVVSRARALLVRAGLPDREPEPDAAPPALQPEEAPKPNRRGRRQSAAL